MSTHITDFTKTEDQIVLDLINHDNESNLSLLQVTIGQPLASVDPARVAAQIVAIPNSGYKDQVEISYRRINLADYVAQAHPAGIVFQQGSATTLVEMLPEINTALGTNIPSSSIVDKSLPEWLGTPNENHTVSLEINSSSKVFEGQFSFLLDGNDIPLSSIVTVNVLSGLNLPTNSSAVTGDDLVFTLHMDPNTWEAGRSMRLEIVSIDVDGNLIDIVPTSMSAVPGVGYEGQFKPDYGTFEIVVTHPTSAINLNVPISTLNFAEYAYINISGGPTGPWGGTASFDRYDNAALGYFGETLISSEFSFEANNHGHVSFQIDLGEPSPPVGEETYDLFTFNDVNMRINPTPVSGTDEYHWVGDSMAIASDIYPDEIALPTWGASIGFDGTTLVARVKIAALKDTGYDTFMDDVSKIAGFRLQLPRQQGHVYGSVVMNTITEQTTVDGEFTIREYEVNLDRQVSSDPSTPYGYLLTRFNSGNTEGFDANFTFYSVVQDGPW